MKIFKIILWTAFLSLWFMVSAQVITHSGMRVSKYGVVPEPFPMVKGWHNAIYTMNTYFPGTIPTTVWTVAEEWGDNECRLYFPNDSVYPTTNLSYDPVDLSEKYLAYFDTTGINVYLQVEPSGADMKTLIDIVFRQYKRHKSIIGFGVDIEWYQCNTTEWGKKVTDAEAQQWEQWVKAHKSTYTLFLKHPDRKLSRFPTTYRGGIIFNNDCEGRSKMTDSAGFANYETDFLGTMKTFADAFFPNPVIFQIGYPSIKKLWQNFDPKPQVVGNDIAKKCKPGQNVQIYWVDFGMKGVLPYSNTWTPLPWPTSIKQVQFVNKKNSFTLNSDEIFNFSAITLNGRVLFSMTGTGNKILQDFNGWNSVHAGSNVFIYRIDNKKGRNSFLTARKVLVK
jgi:hypothetical protein